jgi:hypothetical protein
LNDFNDNSLPHVFLQHATSWQLFANLDLRGIVVTSLYLSFEALAK